MKIVLTKTGIADFDKQWAFEMAYFTPWIPVDP